MVHTVAGGRDRPRDVRWGRRRAALTTAIGAVRQAELHRAVGILEVARWSCCVTRLRLRREPPEGSFRAAHVGECQACRRRCPATCDRP